MTTLKKFNSFKEINKAKFKTLLEDAFSKKLTKGYFSYVKPEYIIIAEKDDEYIGTIVVEKTGKTIYYLDKIAVAKKYHGNGIGKKLWEELHGDNKKIVWRAKENNPINDFYIKQCEGMQKVSGWIIYWRNLTPEELKKAIKYALKKKQTMEEL